MKVALIQMKVGKNKEANLKQAQALIEEAAANGAKMVILPEMFQTPYETACFPEYAEKRGEKTWSFLAEMAAKHHLYLVGGSIPEKDELGKVYNTSFVFNEKGEEIAYHRKRHLFDIDIPDGQYFKESDTLTAGDKSTVFKSEGEIFGLGICFDIRFPEQAEEMIQKGAKVLIYPAAFNPTTGPKHWELLFRSRANDGQAYTIGVASAPNPEGSYQSYGHSLVVNPWGEVILDLEEKEGVGYIDLDFALCDQVRQAIPTH